MQLQNTDASLDATPEREIGYSFSCSFFLQCQTIFVVTLHILPLFLLSCVLRRECPRSCAILHVDFHTQSPSRHRRYIDLRKGFIYQMAIGPTRQGSLVTIEDTKVGMLAFGPGHYF